MILDNQLIVIEYNILIISNKPGFCHYFNAGPQQKKNGEGVVNQILDAFTIITSLIVEVINRFTLLRVVVLRTDYLLNILGIVKLLNLLVELLARLLLLF